jgi:DNA (cytosine-5)-methyltransferase 1
MDDLYVISLFSGAGGLDLGLRLAGFKNFLVANDLLKAPGETYCFNFHHTLTTAEKILEAEKKERLYVVGSVSELDFTLFSKAEGRCIVVGGPPCQDFSIMRGKEKNRKGIETLRGKLYSYYVKALAVLKPIGFIFENVPGLLSANKGTAANLITNSLSKPGLLFPFSDTYEYQILFSGILSADAFGAPQKRRRLIIIGVRKDIVAGIEKQLPSLVKEVFERKAKIFSKFPLSPLEAFEGRTLPELSFVYREIMESYKGLEKLLKTSKASEWIKSVFSMLTLNPVEDYLKLNNIQAREDEIEEAFEAHSNLLKKLEYYDRPLDNTPFPDGSNEIPQEKTEVLERMKRIPPGENYKFVEGSPFSVKGRGLSLIYRRLHPLIPSYTVVAYGGGGTWGYHYRQNRSRLTNRERARLQSFPDYFLFKGSSSQVRAQIGEAVPPLLGEATAEILKSVIELAGCRV